MKKIFVVLIILLSPTGCGLPNKEDISTSIHNGIEYTNNSSWDRALDKAKDIDDYVNLLSYKINQKKLKKVDKQVEEVQKMLVIMDKKRSIKEWNKLKKAWDE